jgi:hypothetical protein
MADDKTQDWGEFAHAMQEKMRGGNDYWFWRDKPEMERGIAAAVLGQVGLYVQQIRSLAPGDDPPDCEGMIGGSLCGIEVTELIDQSTLESSIRGNVQWLVWDREMLCEELQRRIDRKDKPVKGGPYGRYILVVVTDETFLGRHDVAQFLEGATFQARFITEAYLALSYDPSVSSCPVFQLKLVGPAMDRKPSGAVRRP